MVVSIQILKIFRGDMTVLQYVVDYSSRPFGRYLLAEGENARVNLMRGHLYTLPYEGYYRRGVLAEHLHHYLDNRNLRDLDCHAEGARCCNESGRIMPVI